jgi:hypothetical protein
VCPCRCRSTPPAPAGELVDELQQLTLFDLVGAL